MQTKYSSFTTTLLLLLLGLFLATQLSSAKSLDEYQSVRAVPISPTSYLEVDCTGTSLPNLTSSCLTYVTNASNLTRPEKGCCSALATLLSSNAKPCFCQLIAGYNNYGVQIDKIRVLTLPTICRVHPPPTSLCSVVGAPLGSLSPSSKLGSQKPREAARASGTSGKLSFSMISTHDTWRTRLHLLTFRSFYLFQASLTACLLISY